jgi:type III secretory pathway component EscS
MGPWLGSQIMNFALNIFANFSSWSLATA